MKRLCPDCHTLGGCWDAPRLVHGRGVTFGPCDWCGEAAVCVPCMGFDFRAGTAPTQ